MSIFVFVCSARLNLNVVLERFLVLMKNFFATSISPSLIFHSIFHTFFFFNFVLLCSYRCFSFFSFFLQRTIHSDFLVPFILSFSYHHYHFIAEWMTFRSDLQFQKLNHLHFSWENVVGCSLLMRMLPNSVMWIVWFYQHLISAVIPENLLFRKSPSMHCTHTHRHFYIRCKKKIPSFYQLFFTSNFP